MKGYSVRNSGRKGLLASLLGVLAMCWGVSAMAQSGEPLELHAGAVRVLTVGEIDRIAVGKDSVLGASVLDGGRLLVIGTNPGETDLHAWLKDGSERHWAVTVTERNVAMVVATLSSLLEEYPSTRVRSVGGIVIVEGEVPRDQLIAVRDLISRVPGVVSLVEPSAGSFDTLVRNFPRVRYHDEGGITILEGEVPTEDYERFRTLIGELPNVVSMVKPSIVSVAPMVRVSLRLLEVNRDHTRRLGINWEDSFPGPSIGSTGASLANSRFRIVQPGIQGLPDIVSNIAVNDARWYAYAGWTTQVFSTVEMLQQENNATILAEPNLTTRSGQPAKFLAGGEFPYPVIGQFGQPGVEFKEYGIRLDINPTVDEQGNIQTQLTVDVSSIDRANVVNNVPGLLKRNTESTVNLRSGQTMILSGLVSADEVRNMNNVPGVSEIPILGELFKSRNFQNRKTELVVMVTPTLVELPEQTGPRVEATTKRLRRLIDNKILEGAIAE